MRLTSKPFKRKMKRYLVKLNQFSELLFDVYRQALSTKWTGRMHIFTCCIAYDQQLGDVFLLRTYVDQFVGRDVRSVNCE